MVQLIKLGSVFILTLMLSCSSNSDSVVVEDVRVLTMESDEILENQTIIVDEGLISWVGNSAYAPDRDGATVISGDYYVMPGLAETHAHIPSSDRGEEYMEAVLGLYLSQGITTIRGMLGEESHLELRERAAAGNITSPRIITSGPSFSGSSVQSPEQARQMVRDQYEKGYDLLKFHPGLALEEFEAITEEANNLGIEFSGHISYEVGLERSLEAEMGTIDHLDRYMEYLAGDAADREDPPIIYFGYDLTPHVDKSKIDEAAQMTAVAGVWNVPTNTLLVNVFSPDYTTDDMINWPGMEFMAESTIDGWADYVNQIRSREDYDEEQARNFLEIRNNLTFALHENGAGLMLGADAPQIFNPPGFSAHRELAILVDAGLSPFEALKTGTVNVGVYLEEENLTGKVAPGFRADLIFLSSNPLESIPFRSRIEGVMSGGEYLDRSRLDSLLNHIQQVMNE